MEAIETTELSETEAELCVRTICRLRGIDVEYQTPFPCKSGGYLWAEKGFHFTGQFNNGRLGVYWSELMTCANFMNWKDALLDLSLYERQR